jgi:F-box/leucine-rich repeat protein 2/20
MAGVVRSDLLSNNKINYGLLVEMVSNKEQESLKIIDDALNSIKNGGAVHLNKSVNDSYILSLLENESIFKEYFANITNLHLNLESYSLITDKAVSALSKKCPNLCKINLKSCVTISDVSVEEIAKNCPDLEEIDLSWCDVSEQSLFFLGKYSQNLVRIGVRSCYITDRSVEFLLQKCKKLKILGFAWCKSLTDDTIESIIKHCSQVELLDIRGNEKISSIALSKLFNTVSNFKTVHLKRCSGVNEEVILNLSKSKSLKNLNLRGCYKNNNISNDAISKLFEECNNIESLDIAWHNYINDQTIITLANKCTNLRSLDLSGLNLITDKSINILIDSCTSLKKIILFKNNISDDSIRYLKEKSIEVKIY